MAGGMTNYAQWLNENPDDAAAMAAGFPRPAAPAQPPSSAPQYAALETVVRPDAAPPASPAPTAQPAPPPVAPVVAPTTRNAAKALEQLNAQDLAGQNEVTASIGREGESKVDASKKAAAVKGEAAGKSRRYADAAEKEVDDTRIMQDEAERWAHEDMQKLREPPMEKTAWQKTTSALTGILSGVLQGWLGPVGGGLAFGMQAIDDHVSRNVRQQIEEKERAADNLGHTTKYIDALSKDSANELDLASKLMANNYLATSHELEKLAEEAKVPELQEGYRRLALDSAAKARAGLKEGYRQQIADARAAAAARAKDASQKPQWENLPPSVLEQMEREGTLPLAGLNVLNESRKKANDANPKPDEKEAAKLAAPEGRDVADAGLWSSVPDTEKAKYRASEAALAKYNRSSERLQALLEKHGTQAFGEGSGEMSSIAKGLALDLKDISDAGALDKGLIELVDEMHGDPNAWLTSGGRVLERLRTAQEQLNAGQEAKAMQLGLSGRKATRFAPEGAAPASQPAPRAPAAPQPPAPVRMVSPDGRVFDIPADQVPRARARGLRVPGEMTQDEANAPLAADAAEDERVRMALASAGG